jgi:hypothetical protein
MTIEATIQAVLAALAGGRCYPLTAPDPVVKPYIVFQVVSNIPEVTLDGVTDTENRRVQIDIYDKSYGAMKTLELLTKAAMESAAFINIPLASRESYETDTQLYRVSIDYSIWT